jgi:hypothetical protein
MSTVPVDPDPGFYTPPGVTPISPDGWKGHRGQVTEQESQMLPFMAEGWKADAYQMLLAQGLPEEAAARIVAWAPSMSAIPQLNPKKQPDSMQGIVELAHQAQDPWSRQVEFMNRRNADEAAMGLPITGYDYRHNLQDPNGPVGGGGF